MNVDRTHLCRPARRGPAHAAGISLIETLVTLVVLSIGMLGIAALYVESLKAGNTAVSRTRAVSMAADMADRIRSNPGGADSYEATATAASTSPPNACAETAGSAALDCTPAQLAAYDIWQWKTLVGNSTNASAQALGLPAATALIDRDTSTSPTTYIITVNWADKENALSYTLALAL